MKKTVCVILSVMLMLFPLLPAAADKSPKPTRTPRPTAAPMPTLAPSLDVWPVLPPLTEDGYLSPEAKVAEFVHADTENGLWLYISKGLRIKIERFSDPNMPLIWYEADIRSSGEDELRSVPADPKKPDGARNKPETIARANRLVFAINDDQFVARKSEKKTIGVIARNGKVYQNETPRKGITGFPNLDTMALFPGGILRVYENREHTGQEFMDMGATDVFSFGPVLIRDGKENEKLNQIYPSSMQPRCGFGMVEPYHYVCVIVEGRHRGADGTNFLWLASRLREMGATQALNLDGGNTAAIVFMGEKLNANNNTGPDANVRSISGMIAIGTSELVPEK